MYDSTYRKMVVVLTIELVDVPEPIVMSPLSSTSWQTTAFECIVYLSRLKDIISVEAVSAGMGNTSEA
jgi:hypothetical protein